MRGARGARTSPKAGIIGREWIQQLPAIHHLLLPTLAFQLLHGLSTAGGGVGKGAQVTGQFKEASLKSRMMTHHLHCKAAQKNFFKKIPP